MPAAGKYYEVLNIIFSFPIEKAELHRTCFFVLITPSSKTWHVADSAKPLS